MFSSAYSARTRTPLLAMALVVALAGCESKMDKAIDQAKKQAASSGQPQQVVAVDNTGTTTTAVVQPPAKGQTMQAVSTTTTPPPPGGPVPPQQDPKVTPLGGDQSQPPGTDQAGAPATGSGAAGPSGAERRTAPAAPVRVTIPAGTNLAIRIDQHISVKTSNAGDTFTGEVVEPVVDPNGNTIVPKLTPVSGVIDASHQRGRFKGASVLELRLTTMTLGGRQYHLKTADLTESKKGKGKRSAAMIGGGTGLGMLIGGLAGGGKGVLIGGLAGAGAGTAGAGLTGNRDLDIPAETIVHFKLSQDLVVQ
jgi:hypothetical protein